jgi:outer membrane protein TolC
MPSLPVSTLALALVASAVPAGAQQPSVARADTLALTLDEAVTRALRSGDESRLAEAQVDATEAQIVTARAAVLPQLRLNGAYTQVLENARANIVGSVFGQNYTYNTNANLSQPLFQGGRAIAGLQAASRTRAAAQLNVQEARAQATVDVQSAYLNALASAQIVAIRERNLALSAERIVQAEQLERAGRAARYDVLRARVERTNLEPLVIQARNDRDLAVLELKRLLNLPLDRPLRLTTQVSADSTSVLAVLREAARDTVRPAGAAARRSDRAAVRSAELVASARDASVRVARADLLPTVSAFIQSGFLALPSSPGFPTRLGRTSFDFCPETPAPTRACQNNGFFADRQFGLQVTWNVFDGLRTKGNIDQAQAQARIADIQLEQTREQVAVEGERARAGVERAAALYTAQRQNVQEAEEAFRLASLRFTRGVGTQLEVSDAQLALLTAETNAARATFDVYLAAAELARALGRPIPIPGAAGPAGRPTPDR